jgi:arginyl-tRNA synthetase
MNKQQFSSILTAAVQKVSTSYNIDLSKDFSVQIEYPDRKFGDFATPVAMELAKVFRKAPFTIAEDIVNEIQNEELFTKIEVMKPGFINFTLSNASREDIILTILHADAYGKAELKNKRYLIEFVSANPTGPLHIGHGRWAAMGDVMSRIMKWAGYDIQSEFYVNDAGNQIENLKKSVLAVKNNTPIPKDGYHGSYIEEMKDIDIDPVEYFLEMHKKTLSDMSVSFDNFFRESTLHKNDSINNCLEVLRKHDAVYEKDRALWFKTSEYGDEKDRVLVKSDGAFTYFAVDIAYHLKKVERNFDVLINVFGADHHGYTARLNAAVDILSDKKTKLLILIGQLVSLYRDGEPVRMSKRTGDIITLREVLDEIGVDAVRYFLTMRSPNTPLEFDLELAKKNSMDNPVYYIQYAFARICSVFKKAEELSISIEGETFSCESISSDTVNTLIQKVSVFPDIIADIASTFEIHKLNNYLFDMAAVFHKLYNETKFVREEDYTLSTNYLLLLSAVRKVFSIGLDLLGISAPENM